MPTAQQPKKKKKEEIKINVTFSVRVENHPLKYIHQAKEKVSLKSMHYKKKVLRPRFKNAAIGHKNAALRPFGLRPHFLRPRFIPRPKTCDYRPVKSKAALFEPRPKTRSHKLRPRFKRGLRYGFRPRVKRGLRP